MVTLSDLDSKAMEVLEAVYENGGEADTSEIKQYTGIEKNGVVHYRYDKLEEAGLIETRAGDPDGAKVPPTVVTLTEEAEAKVADGLFAEQEQTMVERMDRVERQYRQTCEALRELQRDFDQWRFDPESEEEIGAEELLERFDRLHDLHREVMAARKDWGVSLVEQVDRMKDVQDEQVDRVDGLRRQADALADEVSEIPDQSRLTDLDERLEGLESQAAEAEEKAEQAAERAEEVREELSDEIGSLRSLVDAIREKSLPEGTTFRARLNWLLPGPD
jgi:DNA-binding MarR family transcriptional regulator